MEHPPPLPTTSLEDLPPPYLDYLDAAALCRLGYGTTKKQHYGVTSAAVRCAIDRDAVPLSTSTPPGARDALELLRRRERAVCWEPFGARSQFLRRRWRRGPTTPDDAPRDGDDDDEPPRPWRYRELRTTAAGLVLDGGGEMNFTGVHRRVDARPRRVACRVRTARRSPRRGFFNVCFSSGEAPHRALRFFHVGHADVFSVLVPLNEAHDRIQLWLPSARYPIFVAAPGAGDEVALELRLEWDDAGALAGDGRPCLWLGAKIDGKDAAGPCAVRLPDDGSYDGFRHCYLFSWVQDDDRGAAADAEASIRDLVVEERGVDDAFLADVRAEIGRREACARRGDDVEAVLRTLGLPADPRGDPPPVVVDGDPLGTALGDPGRLDDAEEDWTAGEFGDSDSGASGSEAGSLHGGAVA